MNLTSVQVKLFYAGINIFSRQSFKADQITLVQIPIPSIAYRRKDGWYQRNKGGGQNNAATPIIKIQVAKS